MKHQNIVNKYETSYTKMHIIKTPLNIINNYETSLAIINNYETSYAIIN